MEQKYIPIRGDVHETRPAEMYKRRGIEMRWSVMLDGAVWAGLTLLSALAMFDRVSPPWLLFVTWFSLHPAVMIVYMSARWTMYYPRYLWSMRGWTVTTTWLWLYQTLFFVNHIAKKGFVSDLDLVDSGSATLAAGLAVYVWFDAFWADLVQPYQLVRLSDLLKYKAKLSTKEV